MPSSLQLGPTGQCKQAFSNGKIPYCIKFNPNNENVFLAGMSDKKVIQYDMRSGEIVQEYDQHLGAVSGGPLVRIAKSELTPALPQVNTITFVDENRRFLTSSDDKTMRLWDIDIPVAIKIIAEPSMHSMPAIGKHPSSKLGSCRTLMQVETDSSHPRQTSGSRCRVWTIKSSSSAPTRSSRT